ncbi:hypothetical protein LguiB_022949 [Lonicera macranthoides]
MASPSTPIDPTLQADSVDHADPVPEVVASAEVKAEKVKQWLKEMSAAVIEGNDQVTGHIISTTIRGENGEPKRVCTRFLIAAISAPSMEIVIPL